MASLKNLTSVWNNIKEFEVAPIQKEALQNLRIVLTGAAGSGRHTLAAQMRTDPNRPAEATLANLYIQDLADVEKPAQADLLIVLVDATQPAYASEQTIARRWRQAGVPTIVIFNKLDLLADPQSLALTELWEADTLLRGSVKDTTFLLEQFVPAVRVPLLSKQLALGRNFPLFRVPIARQLINETSFSNAAYALSTGLAEIVPILDIPLNLTDMVILTKAQAFLVYRLGLLLGYSINWQNYLSEFGSVIGNGFLWRQVARQLVGLIPVWGILPKVAISYAGTYVIGTTILQWYLTGRKLTRAQLNALYAQALGQGRLYARRLVDRLPKVKLSRPRLPAWKLPVFKLPAGKPRATPEKSQAVTQPVAHPADQSPVQPDAVSQAAQTCPTCGQRSAADAVFCQYCGKSLTPAHTSGETNEIPLE